MLQGTGNVVAQVAAAPGFGGSGTTNSTIQVQIVNNNGTAAAVATVIDNATGQQTQSAPVACGATISGFQNVNVQLGTFTLSDVGKTATIQIAQTVLANAQNNALTVQSGSTEGNATPVALPGVSASQLQISTIDLSSSLSSTSAIGQLDNAISTLSSSEAKLGAQQQSLQQHVSSNTTAQLNLTASQSNIADLNYGESATNSTLALLKSQVDTALVAHNNVLAGLVLGLFP